MGKGYTCHVSDKKKYAGKLTARVIFICVVAAFGGLTFGYDLGISGGVNSMDHFRKKFFPQVYEKEHNTAASTNQYCELEGEILTVYTSVLYLGAMMSSLLPPCVMRVGRRVTMIAGGLFYFGGVALSYWAEHLMMFMVARTFLGFGIGYSIQSVPIYLSEVAPHNYRGGLNSMFQVSITIGIIVANILNYYFAELQSEDGWRYSLGFAAIPAIMIIIGCVCLPDTPNSLIEMGHNDKARKVLAKIRGTDNVDEEFNDIVAASEASRAIKNPWVALLHSKQYRPPLVFTIAIPLFQQLTGMHVLTFYSPILFKTIGFGATASLASAVITGTISMLANFVSIWTVDKIGRRALFLQGGTQMFLMQVLITTVIAMKFGVSVNSGELSNVYATLVLFAMWLYVAGFAWSWGPLGWLVPGELCPLEVRSAAQTLNVFVSMYMAFNNALLYPLMNCGLKLGIFMFYGCFVAIMSIFIYKLLPETKGIPIEDMASVWEKHPFWSKYVDPEKPTTPSVAEKV